jgi:predicted metal-dependent hydrolase
MESYVAGQESRFETFGALPPATDHTPPSTERKGPALRHHGEATGMESQIRLGDRTLTYQLRRSARRRTIAIAIDPQEGLVVYSPLRVDVAGLQQFLLEKSRWILRHAAKLDEARARAPAVQWEPGGHLPYRGGVLTLAVIPGAMRGTVALEGDTLTVRTPPEDGLIPEAERIRHWVVGWLRTQAAAAIEERVRALYPLVQREPRTVRVREQKRRWGSCSVHGALNFNWRLILAPPDVLDYVVVHELCHLQELNHSPRFWEWVGRILPEYRTPRAWLRHNGILLDI